MIKLGIIGALGKMGLEILSCSRKFNDIFISSCHNNKYNNKICKDFIPMQDIKFIKDELRFTNNIEDVFKESDIVIDFSTPNGLNSCLSYVEKYDIPFVSGTSGISQEILLKMKNLGEKRKICWSMNMSLGANLVSIISGQIAKILNDFDCEIIESHHNKKIDSPSGTAFLIANAICENRNIDLQNVIKCGRNGNEIRKKDEIGFHSIRGGSIFGEHEIKFIGLEESVSIKHTAFNRAIFATGAIKCAIILLKEIKENGFFSFQDLIMPKIKI